MSDQFTQAAVDVVDEVCGRARWAGTVVTHREHSQSIRAEASATACGNSTTE